MYMNKASKEIWKYILKKNIGSYGMFIKDVESVSLLHNGNYIVKSIIEGFKPYFVELSRDIVYEFLKSRKTEYSETILDHNMNFEVIITDTDLYKKHIELVYEATKKDFTSLEENIKIE